MNDETRALILELLADATENSHDIQSARQAWEAFKATPSVVSSDGQSMSIDEYVDSLTERQAMRFRNRMRPLARAYILERFYVKPVLEPGVVKPSGGPYDYTIRQRSGLWPFNFNREGEMNLDAFPTTGRGAKVTVSVEGFPTPLTFRAKLNDSVPIVIGQKIIDGMKYAFIPKESGYRVIDESKAWVQLGEPYESLRTKKGRMLPWERDLIDARLLAMIRSRSSRALRGGDFYISPFTTVHEIDESVGYHKFFDQYSPGSGETIYAESEAAKELKYGKKERKSAIAGSLKRLERKGLIYQGETPGIFRDSVKGYADIEVMDEVGTFWDFPQSDG
jgi:hypothetical protein|tara:strand:- start:1454 stop:2458 length:1005 start_codon:yes stop_codon:yes gene_type:complete